MNSNDRLRAGFYCQNYNLSTFNRLLNRPVSEIIEQIKNNSKRTHILVGTEKSGKTVTALNYSNQDQYEEGRLYIVLDELIVNESDLNKDFLENYVELFLYDKIYNYTLINMLKLYYNSGYDYSKINIELDRVKENLINNNSKLISNYRTGELIIPLIKNIKQKNGLKKFNLIIEDLDHHNVEIQKLLEKYFVIFDKVILTTSDKKIYSNLERRAELEQRGFNIIDVEYGKEEINIINIINKRIAACNIFSSPVYGWHNIDKVIDKKELIYAIGVARGNIEMLIETVYRTYLIASDKGRLDVDINKEFRNNFKMIFEEQKEKKKKEPVKTLHL